MFKFKQFVVHQDKCAMKVGTDGLLLGVMSNFNNKKKVLDIGTGTGLISLVIAQLNNICNITAVEIDKDAATQAGSNFETSPWSSRLMIYNKSIFDFDDNEKYDLIVSNPPYFIESLKCDKENKSLARHVDLSFFDKLSVKISSILADDGEVQIILPVNEMIKLKKSLAQVNLYPVKQINVHSFENTKCIREIVTFKRNSIQYIDQCKFVIYKEQKKYSEQYINCCKDFLTIF